MNEKKIVLALILSLLVNIVIVPLSYSKELNFNNFKKITGISYNEIKSCNKDSDCITIPVLMGCCANEFINKKYRNVVEKNRNILWNNITPPELQKLCSLVRCITPQEKAICRNNICMPKSDTTIKR